MERQEAPTLAGIQKGHVERYLFASNRVKGRVLDAACGVGYGSKLMMDSGCKVVGVDAELEAIHKAEEHYPGPEYVHGSIYDSPWMGEFDYVVSLETVEHLHDPLNALRHFRQDSKWLICSTPNEDHYPFDPLKFKGDKYPHLRHYKPRELTELLNQAGWEVVQKYCQPEKTSPVIPGTDGMFLIFVCR